MNVYSFFYFLSCLLPVVGTSCIVRKSNPLVGRPGPAVVGLVQVVAGAIDGPVSGYCKNVNV